MDDQSDKPHRKKEGYFRFGGRDSCYHHKIVDFRDLVTLDLYTVKEMYEKGKYHTEEYGHCRNENYLLRRSVEDDLKKISEMGQEIDLKTYFTEKIVYICHGGYRPVFVVKIFPKLAQCKVIVYTDNYQIFALKENYVKGELMRKIELC
jgi:hypothetical protein